MIGILVFPAGFLHAAGQQQDGRQAAPQGNSGASQPAVLEDCCTPEATARIAAAAGFIEIAGIKLGMPAQDAVAALKAHRPELTIDPPAIIRMDLLPGVDFVTGIGAGAGNPGGPAIAEEIQIAFTLPPSEPSAWGVLYQVRYPAGAMPTVGDTLAALRTKYGPESGTTMSERIAARLRSQLGVDTLDAYWVFDVHGRRLPQKEASEFYESCSQYAFGVKVTLSDNSFMKGRGEWLNPATRTNCGNNTVVTASWMASEPSRGEPKGLVRALTVEGGNGLLHRSAYEATYAMEIKAAGGKGR